MTDHSAFAAPVQGGPLAQPDVDTASSTAASTIPTARHVGAVNWIGMWTLYRREVMRFLKVSSQTIIAPLMTTLLYMLVFSLALGQTRLVGGISYTDFLAPGLVMMAVLTNAFANSSSSLMIAKVQGNAVDFLMPPLSATELTLAFIGGAATRGVLMALVGLLVVAPFTHHWPHSVFGVVFFALVASILFGALGLIGGLWAKKFDDLQVVSNFIVTPVTFLSGTFYSVDALPGFVRTLAHANPCFFVIDGFRWGMTGHADGDVLLGAIASLVFALGLSTVAWELVRRGFGLKN